MKRFLLIIFLLSALGAHAQHSKEEMIRYLTNGAFRTWIFKDYRVTLGPSCSGDGQSFDFYKTGIAVWKRCRDGKPAVDSLKWSIVSVPNSPGEFYIQFTHQVAMISGSSFDRMLLNLPNPEIKTRKKEMLWNKTPDCKSCPEAIIDFTSKN